MECILVIGPAGAGKSTFCKGFQEFLRSLGKDAKILNLDPANENLPYVADVDICDLITLDDVCESMDLGPNGGLLYCMDFIHTNITWLNNSLSSLGKSLLLIDCPGQIELFAQHPILPKILSELTNRLNCKSMALNIIDSNLCSNAHIFIASCLMSLSIMTHLELPHLNVLSKIDLLRNFHKDLAFGLEFYTDISQLAKLISIDDQKFNPKLARMSEKIAEIIDDFGLVSFQLLSIDDKELMGTLTKQIARTLGTQLYYEEDFNDFSVSERIQSIEEKYLEGQ